MASYSPQTNYFKIAKKINTAEKWFVYAVTIISLLLIIMNKENNQIFTLLSVVGALMIYVFDFFLAHYQQKAEEIRRKDFFDNSFGTKFLNKQSEKYYDNDEVGDGLYKALVNVFENSFFSLTIARRMKVKIMYTNIILLILLSICIIVGIFRLSYAMPVLQLLLSKYYLQQLISIWTYTERVEVIYERIVELFVNGCSDKKIKNSFISARAIQCLIDYEANISWCKVFLDSRMYNKLNNSLTIKWRKMKKMYNI